MNLLRCIHEGPIAIYRRRAVFCIVLRIAQDQQAEKGTREKINEKINL